ncbi:hypothetical protein MO973_17705 [Paenibacillus sp. TRM 82003]|uniref:serine O-acetyltransferase n=1 Tax=Kineococcus sp. TRM81007 TaxID=2925831 RepID=UPI001F5AECC4|nr:hypothetical protein [Kineococcus sp. TRM81007]MCI2238422.1 hypothetical protein [Kineococcus sp. TRM81007]MCI3922065.1 hypothetical protein [Paenibacillus sp. TRM 82003]
MRARRGVEGTTTWWDLVREDFATHGRRPLSPGFHALAAHRLGRSSMDDRSLKGRLAWTLARAARVLVVNLYGVELPPDASVGRRLHLPHAQGVVLVPGSVIGDDCLVRHNVTLGLGSATRGGRPVVGDRVQFGPGSSAVGAVTVGDDVLVGPHALVIDDVPAGSRVLAPVATVRPPRPAANRVDVREDPQRFRGEPSPVAGAGGSGPAEDG